MNNFDYSYGRGHCFLDLELYNNENVHAIMLWTHNAVIPIDSIVPYEFLPRWIAVLSNIMLKANGYGFVPL